MNLRRKPLSNFVVVTDDATSKYIGQTALVRRFADGDAYVTMLDGCRKALFQGEFRAATEREKNEYVKAYEAKEVKIATDAVDQENVIRAPDTYDVTQKALHGIIAPGELMERSPGELRESLRLLLNAQDAIAFEVRRLQTALSQRKAS